MTTKAPIRDEMFSIPGVLSKTWVRFFTDVEERVSGADPEYDSVTITGLTGARLVATSATKALSSVSDLTSWIQGVVGQVVVTDNSDGTITLSLPQNLDTNADLEFDSVVLSDLTPSRLTASDASNELVSVETLSSWIIGNLDQVYITDNGDGSVTLYLPQNIGINSDVEFGSITLSGLTATRLTATDASKEVVSVSTLSSWIAGTADEVTVTDDGDGTLTISLPDAIKLDGATATRLLATNSSKITASVSALSAWIAGTTNQVYVADDGDGTITLSLPQDIDTGAVVSFLGGKLGTTELIGNATLTAASSSIILAIPGVGEYTAVYNVPSDNNDGYGYGPSALFDNTGAVYLEQSATKIAFFRFTKTSGDDLPQGAIVISATFNHYVQDDGWVDPNFYMNVYGNDIDSAVAPTNASELYALIKTTAYDELLFTRIATGWRTGDLANSIQEVLDRPGFATNNPLQIIFSGPSTPGYRKNIGGNSAWLEINFASTVQTITIESTLISGSPGRIFVVQKNDTSAYRVDITCEGSETINGETTFSLFNPYDAVFLIMPDSGTDVIAVVVPASILGQILGTTGEITVTDNSNGTITLGLDSPIGVTKGGTGLATITDHGLLLGSGTGAVTPLAAATDGQLPVGSTGADPVLATITGTANQITVTNAAGAITLSLAGNVIESFTVTGTIATASDIILASGTFDLFLPTLANGDTRVYEVKNTGSGIVTLKPNATEAAKTIDGETSQAIRSLDALTVHGDNTNDSWWII